MAEETSEEWAQGGMIQTTAFSACDKSTKSSNS